MMNKKVEWCGCMDVRSFKDGVADLVSREIIDGKFRGEIWELFEAKSMAKVKDELSDIAWGIGRIIGGMMNKPYVRVPGDRAHYRKAVNRINEYGCKRSERFLVDGKCPSKNV